MPRKEFEAFTRLDASDVNTYLMDQSVMSFAGTAARGSAIPSPVEGLTTYREDIARLETYNGSIYTSPSDLILIKTQTIGSAVSSVAVTSVFSANYDSYKVIVSGGVGSATSNLALQIGSASTGYYLAGAETIFSTGVVTGAGANNQSTFPFVGHGSASGISLNCDITNPFAASRTIINGSRVNLLTSGGSLPTAGFLNDTNSYTGFTISPISGTLTGGTIFVYGYRKNL
jgi:hypothetical protein